jgi:hypothetical protein
VVTALPVHTLRRVAGNRDVIAEGGGGTFPAGIFPMDTLKFVKEGATGATITWTTELAYTGTGTGIATPATLPDNIHVSIIADTIRIFSDPIIRRHGVKHTYTITTTSADGCPPDTVTGTIRVRFSRFSMCIDTIPFFGGPLTSVPFGTLGQITWGTRTNTDIDSGITIIPGTDGRPTQLWSGAVQAFGCRKNTFDSLVHARPIPGTSNYPNVLNAYFTDCRQSQHAPYSNQGHFFSWCAVMRFQDSLCPYPWRVPTLQQMIELDLNMGGDGGYRGGQNPQPPFTNITDFAGDPGGTLENPTFGGRWGGARWTGRARPSDALHMLESSTYWTATPGSGAITQTQGHVLRFGFSTNVNIQRYILGFLPYGKNQGFALRCIREAP